MGAVKIKEQHYGKGHFMVAVTLMNLANAHGDLGDNLKRKDLLEQVVQIEERHYGKDTWELATTLGNLAGAHGVLGDTRKKAQILSRVLPTFEAHYGKHHKHSVIVREQLAKIRHLVEPRFLGDGSESNSTGPSPIVARALVGEREEE